MRTTAVISVLTVVLCVTSSRILEAGETENTFEGVSDYLESLQQTPQTFFPDKNQCLEGTLRYHPSVAPDEDSDMYLEYPKLAAPADGGTIAVVVGGSRDRTEPQFHVLVDGSEVYLVEGDVEEAELQRFDRSETDDAPEAVRQTLRGLEMLEQLQTRLDEKTLTDGFDATFGEEFEQYMKPIIVLEPADGETASWGSRDLRRIHLEGQRPWNHLEKTYLGTVSIQTDDETWHRLHSGKVGASECLGAEAGVEDLELHGDEATLQKRVLEFQSDEG